MECSIDVDVTPVCSRRQPTLLSRNWRRHWLDHEATPLFHSCSRPHNDRLGVLHLLTLPGIISYLPQVVNQGKHPLNLIIRALANL
jgi:hypothetical protein